LNEDDALQIEHPLYNKILQAVKDQLNSELQMDEQFFVNHEDDSIRQLAADLLTDFFELSPAWSDNGIFIKTEKENYINDLQSLFLFLKKNKIEKMIQNNLDEMAKSELEQEQKEQLLYYHIQLIEVRNAISEILGSTMN
jgi:DNA primase